MLCLHVCLMYDTFLDGKMNERSLEIGWKILPRGDVAPHWSGLYVTMNKQGAIVISRVTHERLGSPAAYLIMLDAFNHRLGLKPADSGTRHAYPARDYGRRRGSKIIRAYRIITEFGIRPPDTIEFQSPKIDPEGILILDLRNLRISPKAHSQCRVKGQYPER